MAIFSPSSRIFRHVHAKFCFRLYFSDFLSRNDAFSLRIFFSVLLANLLFNFDFLPVMIYFCDFLPFFTFRWAGDQFHHENIRGFNLRERIQGEKNNMDKAVLSRRAAARLMMGGGH
ncbi:hypothetical protein [Dickeya dianthicola]|uniref:hypothetical protein n=1 Tax=Dickeya dianthicola TaxID=204039 RepID=UPI0018679B17|nr:hypothetical protein [Dickeya dianthicola]QOL16479.1 hypothetical protein HGI48_21180 [Dickeya dianthicola]